MPRTVNITSTATPASGETITATTYRLLAADGTTELSTAAPPYAGVSDGLLHVEQTVTQSDAQQDTVTIAIAGRVTDLAATVVSDTAINLAWTDVGGETAYDVHRSTTAAFTPGAGNIVAAGTGLAAGTIAFSDTGLTASTAYYYQIVARNAAGGTTASNEATATTDAASAGPTIYGQDTFTDANGVLLHAHTPDVGSGWTQLSGSANAAITSNRLFGGSGSAAHYYMTDAPASADYEIECIATKVSNIATDCIIRIRWDGVAAGSPMYFLEWNEASTSWRLRRNSTFAALGTDYVDAGFTTGQSRTIILRVEGTAITVLIDGTERITATDSTHTAAGFAGFGLVSSTSNGIHLDDFEVRSIAA